MKIHSKLSFSELEKELEVVSNGELKSYLGGRWVSWGGYDDYVWDLGWLDEVVVYGNSGGGPAYGDFWRGFGNGYEDYGDYGGGSSGGNSQNTQQNNDPINLAKDRLPKICKQSSSSAECGIFSFDVVSKFFGGDKMGINKDDFAESIGINTQLAAHIKFGLASSPGLNKEEYNKISDTFFNNESLDGSVESIISSLKEGHPVITSLTEYGIQNGQIVENGHLVVITGYDPTTNKVTIMDSLARNSQRTRVIDYDPGSFKYQKSIQGIKDSSDIEKYKKDKDWWKRCTIDE